MKRQTPQLGAALCPGRLEQAVAEAMEFGDPVSGLCFTGQQAPLRAEEVEFKGCRFESCSFTGCKWESAEWVDCTFFGCDFSGARLEGASLHRCELEDCKLVGLVSHEACLRHTLLLRCVADYWDCGSGDLKQVCFEGCSLPGAALTECRLGAEFVRCRLAGAGFSGSDLKAARFESCALPDAAISGCKPGVAFSNCKMQGVNLFHTPLRGVDFTTCEIDGLVVAAEDLKGAVVTMEQAAGLSKLMGLIIKP